MNPIINLTSWEYQDACKEAYKRLNVWVGEHSYIDRNMQDANVLGACGEAAVAKWLRLDYVRRDDWQAGDPALYPDIEVKTSHLYGEHRPRLILQGNNRPERRYVLVTKQRHRGYHYTIEGWAYGWEVFETGIEYQPDSGRGGRFGSYWLDPRMLHDPEELRASVLLEL